jgi:hypothetical protein
MWNEDKSVSGMVVAVVHLEWIWVVWILGRYTYKRWSLRQKKDTQVYYFI